MAKRQNPTASKIVDWSLAGKMAEAGCVGTEIAAHFGMHADTLYRKCREEFGVDFTAWIAQKRSHGDALIKMAQFQAAITDKDRGMLIWLGKNRLGQADKNEVSNTIQEIRPIIEWDDTPSAEQDTATEQLPPPIPS